MLRAISDARLVTTHKKFDGSQGACMSLTCPKCHGDMRQYERNGVHVDQCTECRGVFLDRGELERLIDAERAWTNPPASPAPPNPGERPYQQPGHSSGQSGYGSKPKKRKSFFEDLFE